MTGATTCVTDVALAVGIVEEELLNGNLVDEAKKVDVGDEEFVKGELLKGNPVDEAMKVDVGEEEFVNGKTTDVTTGVVVGADELAVWVDDKLVKGGTVILSEADKELLNGRTIGVTIAVLLGPEVLLIGYKVAS